MSANLGAVVSQHRGRFAAGGVNWYLGGLALLAGGWGLINELINGELINVPFFLLVLGGAGLWLFWLWSRWKQTLTIYTDGFEWRRIARAPLVVRFDEVTGVDVYRVISRQAMHLKGEHVEITLRLRDNRKVKITNDIEGVEQLVGYVERPAAVEASAASPWGAP